MTALHSARLVLQDVSLSFGSLSVLDAIGMTVEEGQFVSLVGPSGCGKSTLLDLVSGLSVPDHGDIRLAERSIIGSSGHAAYMPQQDALFPWRTIIDNVIVPLEVQGVPRKEALVQAKQLLPLFGLEGFSDHYPVQLSGGMRQRVSLLRTYLGGKSLMLLDEPFASLDALTRLRMQMWLLDIWQQLQRSVILVTHDMEEALLLSDRIYVLGPRPAQVIATIEVPFERPRRKEMTSTPDFVKMRAELLAYFEDR